MRLLNLLAFLIAVALISVACAGGGGGTTSPGTTSAAQTSPASPGGGGDDDDDDDDDAIVQIGESDLGQILVDAEGRTLYGFVPDEESGEPTCYDDCATAWPPVVVEDDDFDVGDDLSEDDFSTAERTDGGTQLKIGNHPLYYFADDAAPGDTNGQGVGGNWFVVGPDGELIREGG